MKRSKKKLRGRKNLDCAKNRCYETRKIRWNVERENFRKILRRENFVKDWAKVLEKTEAELFLGAFLKPSSKQWRGASDRS